MEIKRVYISGKITGLPIQEVIRKFETAREKLQRFNFEVVNPLNNGLPFDAEWADQMGKDVALMLRCDAIYLLSNYSSSKGALIELAIARQMRMPIFIEEAVKPEDRPEGALTLS